MGCVGTYERGAERLREGNGAKRDCIMRRRSGMLNSSSLVSCLYRAPLFLPHTPTPVDLVGLRSGCGQTAQSALGHGQS